MALLSNVSLVVLVAVMVGVVSAGAGPLRRAVVIGLLGWLAVTAALAGSGVLANWTAVPPRWPLVPLAALAAILVATQTAAVRRQIGRTPRHWIIAAQTFRVGVELVFYALHADGRAPEQITFAGQNFDILVGLSAPLVAWLVARGRLAPALVLLWNAAGLALLVNAVRVVATSTPGPLHRAWPGEPFAAIATWPVIWVPALLVPLAVFFHVASIRQTLAARLRPRSSRAISGYADGACTSRE